VFRCAATASAFSLHLTPLPNQIISLAIFALVAVCAAAPRTIRTNEMNIVQLAESVKDLSTLVTAVVAANLTSALEGGGAVTQLSPAVAAQHHAAIIWN
jgi:uncharacterized surface protein with fasciclin (FAS1) repeats